MTRGAIELCIEGTQAEYERRIDDARQLYAEAWNVATDDYERCVAAHYVAHLTKEPPERHRWNVLALDHAERSGDERVTAFYGSLYVNLGESHELLGDRERAAHYYALAAEHGVVHQV